jgi:hypothetical protein
VAVGFDWQVIFDAELHVHKGWVFGVNFAPSTRPIFGPPS